MARRDLKSLLLGGLARWLGRWARFLDRQSELWTALARRSREAAAGSPPAPSDAAPEEQAPRQPGEPPAHWLERIRQSGRPLRWMEYRAEPAPPRRGDRRPRAERPAAPRASPPSDASPGPGEPPRAEEPTAGPVTPPMEREKEREPARTQAEDAGEGAPSQPPTPARLIPRPQSARESTGVEQLAAGAGPAKEEEPPQPPTRLWARPVPETGPPEAGPREPAPERRRSASQEEAKKGKRAQPEAETKPERTTPKPQPERRRREPPSATPTWPPLARPRPPRPVMAQEEPRPTVVIERSADLGSPPEEKRHREPGETRSTASVETANEAAARELARRAESDLGRGGAGRPAPARSRQRIPAGSETLWEEETPEDRWPALVGEEPEAPPLREGREARTAEDEDWEAQLRAWQRLRRLDEEQRGNLWSASPF